MIILLVNQRTCIDYPLRPSGRGSRTVISTQSHFRKRSALNAEMVSCRTSFQRSAERETAVKDSQNYIK